MVPQRAIILRIHDNKKSVDYSIACAESCDVLRIPWEFYEGFSHEKFKKEKKDLWSEVMKKGIEFPKKPSISGPAAFCTAGHYAIWKKIMDDNICTIVLEHDALLLHRPEIDIPDDVICALGYKVKDPQNYDHKRAGPPRILEDRKKHGGAHAYAITPKTAKTLLGELKKKPRPNFIDNAIFLTGSYRGEAKLQICNPICALGWLRESTIWKTSAVDNYAPILPSFQEHYNSKENLGIKKS